MGYTVYKHTSPNGKVYIGITSKDVKVRWSNGKSYRNNKHFRWAIEKYGWDNFKHEILNTDLTKEEAMSIERELIARYKSNDQEYGYNVSSGGESSSGYRHTEEEKQRIANSLRGVKHTEERCRKQSISKKRQWEDPEYRKRMTEVHLGKQRGANSPCSKPVNQYSLQGEFITRHEGLTEAERKTGIDRRQIADCCHGKQKTAHGYKWAFAQ